MDVHIHANFILIRKQLVGILDVWANAIQHVYQDAYHHALDHVLEMKKKNRMIINLEKAKDVHHSVQLIALDRVMEYARAYA